MRSDGARASVHCGPRQWKQPPGWITAEDREVLPLPPFLPIAFWHKGVGLCGHAAGASRLPGVFAVFCCSELGARAYGMGGPCICPVGVLGTTCVFAPRAEDGIYGARGTLHGSATGASLPPGRYLVLRAKNVELVVAHRRSSCFRPRWTEAEEAASGLDPRRGSGVRTRRRG
jgi:hypothetical protein